MTCRTTAIQQGLRGTRALLGLAVITLLSTFAACTDEDSPPGPGTADVVLPSVTVTRVEPIEGPIGGGTIMAIYGSNFDNVSTVTVGGKPCSTVVVQDDTLLVALVPPGDVAGAVDVAVTNAVSDGELVGGFTYWEEAAGSAPSITNLRPARGPNTGGTVALLEGTNFKPGAIVYVGFKQSPSVYVVSSTTATFVSPPGTDGVAPAALVNPDGRVVILDPGFEYYTLGADAAPAPEIASVVPEKLLELAQGETTVNGANFDPEALVIVGGLEAGVTYLSAQELRLAVPPNPTGFVDLHVTHPDGQSATLTNAIEFVSLAPGDCATQRELCPAGTYCDGTSCVPKKVGDDPCVADLQCTSGFCDGGRCAAACDPTAVPACPSSAYCDDGACVAKKGDTAPCTLAEECTAGFCTEGFCGEGCSANPEVCGTVNYCDGVDCQPKKTDGSDCQDAIECIAGTCSEGLCGEGCQADPGLCGANEWCDGIDCLPKGGGGEPCGANVECLSGFCDTALAEPACGGCAVDGDCDDGNPCTDDTCGPDAACVTTNNTASCDDGDLCTHSDACLDGSCVGQTITCDDDSGACGANRSCNGSDTCTVNYPGGGTSCNDNEACTYNDACDGAGGCSGTSITCNDDSGVCGANRACNGTSSCTVTYPGSSTSCNDGNACTYNDDCNGSGGCSGTSITCNDDSGTCGANRSCNGTSSCTVNYPGGGTSCSDGNACTVNDSCNGSGSCVGGGSASDGTSCGPNPANRCCGGSCRNLTNDVNHCGGCGLSCHPGQQCQDVSTTPLCSSSPANTSGRCTCAGATSQCPNNTNEVGSDGQVCRTFTPYNNVCSPVSNAGCAPGQVDVNIGSCPDYCLYQ